MILKKNCVCFLLIVILVVTFLGVTSCKTLYYGSVGRDTILVFSDGKYQILKSGNEKNLVMYDDQRKAIDLLQNVISYKVLNNKLYVISSEGYCVSDAVTGKSIIYITQNEAEYIKGYEYVNGKEIPISKKVSHNDVKYISAFEEFSDEDSEILLGFNDEENING